MTTAPKPRVDHLKAGDHAVLIFAGGIRVEGQLLADAVGTGALLYLGDPLRRRFSLAARWEDGRPHSGLVEVVSPLPPEPPLPVGQVRVSSDGEWVGIRGTDEYACPWSITNGRGETMDKADDFVRGWGVMHIAEGAAIDTDQLAETITCGIDAALLATGSRTEIAAAIRNVLPDCTTRALPEGCVAVSLNDWYSEAVEEAAKTPDISGVDHAKRIGGIVARAWLAQKARKS